MTTKRSHARACKVCGRQFRPYAYMADLLVCPECYEEEARHCPQVCGSDDAYLERLDWWARVSPEEEKRYYRAMKRNPSGGKRLPSLKTILERLPWLDKLPMPPEASALLIRQAMEYAETGTIGDLFGAFIEQEGMRPRIFQSRIHFALEAMNIALDTFGVDFVAPRRGDYSAARGLEFLNTGETYTPTVIYDHGSKTWKITSWGDIVERYPNRFGG